MSTTDPSDREREKRLAGQAAARLIENGMTVGLGTGSTARYAVEEAARRVSEGLVMRAVATSEGTEALARRLGVTTVPLDEVKCIDLCIDGVDEIDGAFNAIKGGGGALFREKIVASLSAQVVWIMDSSKRVGELGRFPLPAEILPFGFAHTLRKLEELGYHPLLRGGSAPYVTDNGNYLADLHIGAPLDVSAVSASLRGVTGVLETGLFINFCHKMIVGRGERVQTIENPSAGK